MSASSRRFPQHPFMSEVMPDDLGVINPLRIFHSAILQFSKLDYMILRMWIDRSVASLIQNSAATRPAVLLTGARQTGKTSLLRRLFPEHNFVSLDLPSAAASAETNPTAFLQANPPPLIIDEVQYAPAIFRHLKIWIDAHRDQTGQFILTGSQKTALMEHSSESLAGRVSIIELETLSRQELHLAGCAPEIPANLLSGGYPELHANPAMDRELFYSSYLATYLERDVRQMVNVGSLRDFERFIRAAAIRSGQLLNKSDLARDVGVSSITINKWLSALEASGIVVLLEPWFGNRLKSLVKSPKLYFADTGLLCALLGIRNEEELLRENNLGAIWETFVFGEIRRAHEQAWRRRCFFIADRVKEVDFVIEKAGRLDLLEAKWSEHPGRGDTTGIEHFKERLGANKIGRAAIIARTPLEYQATPDIAVLPIERLWPNPA